MSTCGAPLPFRHDSQDVQLARSRLCRLAPRVRAKGKEKFTAGGCAMNGDRLCGFCQDGDLLIRSMFRPIARSSHWWATSSKCTGTGLNSGTSFCDKSRCCCYVRYMVPQTQRIDHRGFRRKLDRASAFLESASHCHAGGTPGTRDHAHAEGVSSRNAKERQWFRWTVCISMAKFQNICAGQPRAFHRDVTEVHDLEVVVAAIFCVSGKPLR